MNIRTKLIFLQILLLSSCFAKNLPNVYQNIFNDEQEKLTDNNISEELFKKICPDVLSNIHMDNTVKFLSLAPEYLGQRKITLNVFRTSKYIELTETNVEKNLDLYNSMKIDFPGILSFKSVEKNFNSYASMKRYLPYILSFQNGEKNYLYSRALGMLVECSTNSDFLVPEKIYFRLKNGKWDHMEVEYNDTKTKFIYKNSNVVVDNKHASTIPFYKNSCNVNIGELSNLIEQLQCRDMLQFIKYFLDCAATINGTLVTYSSDNYFSHEYDMLGEQYFYFNDEYEYIKTRIKTIQNDILNKKKNLVVQKLFITCENSQHVILLVYYKGKWFLLDSCDTRGYNDKKLGGVLKILNIGFNPNNDFIQIGNTCDTCVSLITFFFSEYYKNKGELPLFTEDNTEYIDLKKINEFVKKNSDFAKMKNCFFHNNPQFNKF